MKTVTITLSTSFAGAMALMILLAGGPIASAQSASPTATATPGVCAITEIPVPNSTPTAANCATGAEPPPSYLGVSGGNINSVDKTGLSCCTGTFGALVQDSNSIPYVLSTNSVLARTSSTARSAAINEDIVQPGLVDLGCWQDASDTVAKLSKSTKLRYGGGTNLLDAAIAKVVNEEQSPGGPQFPGIRPDGAILNLGQISSTPFPYTSLVDALPVMKMGRTTCLTSGVIDAFDAMGKVVYAKECNAATSGTAFFNHQILVLGESTSGSQTCTFAKTGDAGALVVTQDFSCPQAIGIMFAGTPAAGTAYTPDSNNSMIVAVNPIQTILSTFKVTLVGQSCTASKIGTEMASSPPPPSAALLASIEIVRKVKVHHARRLLRNKVVTAVGIGAGDTPDTAALAVYVSDDSPAALAKIPAEINGVKVKIRHAGVFHAL
ncbi:MAG: hypothetical protein IVW54_11715 [Candidatus Binataceae bacterium]|nr:hypothetical protein [Candidatus Binataceae bacterium]